MQGKSFKLNSPKLSNKSEITILKHIPPTFNWLPKPVMFVESSKDENNDRGRERKVDRDCREGSA